MLKKVNLSAVCEDDDFIGSKDIELIAAVDSINTKDDARDKHLKLADFFDSSRHSHIKVLGTGYSGSKEKGKLTGKLTIKGITKPITVDVEFGGITVDGYGQTKAGFTIEGKLSRKEFGITWGAVTEAGNVVVGDEVKFSAEIQLIKQP